MRKVVAVATLLVTTCAALAAPLPRPSPDFTIAEPGKAPLLLSSLRGKVVVMEFMFVRSAHCRQVAQTLNKLQGELGSRGFQPVGVVFDPPTGSTAGAQVVDFLRSYLSIAYPVGYASKEAVDAYLDRTQIEVLAIPQVVVIDRNGVIRATTGGRGGNTTLEDEGLLRELLERLLAENPS